ncbi:nickel pincer cofactor biosynthesis protein LarC [Candidatus Binatia bacterium]|nr:nickel pincer cofactor biosynthesis protein LarC [Candidatus Binatia bacterium]
MRVLYLDTIAGISGDMTVGALLALGLPLRHLRGELARLSIGDYTLSATRRNVNGIVATKFNVRVGAVTEGDSGGGRGKGRGRGSGEDGGKGASAGHRDHGHEHGHEHRPYRVIRDLVRRGGLDPAVRDTALAVFARLAAAEAKVHGVSTDAVTFHEVGAVDSIVDIVGCAIGMHWFGIERVYASPLPMGSGTVLSEHGPLPVPAPATVELLRGFPVRVGEGTTELVTPTGAAIVAALATPDPVPALRIAGIGYGAGQRTLSDRPNVLRTILGETEADTVHERLAVIETNIDDLNPEFYEHIIERLFEAGARDVYLAPVHMKKNRPGIVLSVLCGDAERAALTAIVLGETSSLGVRVHTVERIAVPREIRTVDTPYGRVRVKVATAHDGTEHAAPEYEDCRHLARARGVPLKRVYQAALLSSLAEPGRGA